MKWTPELQQAADQATLRERLASAVAAGETLAALRSKAAQATVKRLESDTALAPVYAGLKAFGEEQAELARALAAGEVGRRYAQRRLGERWKALDRPDVRALLQPIFDDVEAAAPADRQARALLGHAVRQQRLTIERDWFGSYGYLPGSGVAQQGLDGDGDEEPAPDPTPGPAPFRECGTAFDLPPRTAQTADGPGLSSIDTQGGPGGKFRVFASSVLLVLGGVGAQAMAAVGRSVRWPAGYGTLSVSATLDYTMNLWGHMLGAGGSTSSAELFVEVLVDSGPSLRIPLPLGALVAPVAWGAEWRRNGRVVLNAQLAIPGTAGSARVYAGTVGSAATGGVAITAGCWASVYGEVTELCISLA